jgi:hypothetical protein
MLNKEEEMERRECEDIPEPLTRQETICDICRIQYASDIEKERHDFVYLCSECEMEFIEKIRDLLRDAMRKHMEKKTRHDVRHAGLNLETSPIDKTIIDYFH